MISANEQKVNRNQPIYSLGRSLQIWLWSDQNVEREERSST